MANSLVTRPLFGLHVKARHKEGIQLSLMWYVVNPYLYQSLKGAVAILSFPSNVTKQHYAPFIKYHKQDHWHNLPAVFSMWFEIYFISASCDILRGSITSGQWRPAISRWLVWSMNTCSITTRLLLMMKHQGQSPNLGFPISKCCKSHNSEMRTLQATGVHLLLTHQLTYDDHR